MRRFLAKVAAASLALSTNVMEYANVGTLNIDAQYGVARHWTVCAGVKYNPFTLGEGDGQMQKRQRTLSAGARWWPWHVYSGWWVSGNLRYQEYNFGGWESPVTREGDRWGGIASAGYTYMLTPHLNIDMGIGFWSGYDRYRTFACQNCGRIMGEGGKVFFLPSDILLSLTYIF